MSLSRDSGTVLGGNATRWESLRPERTVAAVTRTFTSAVRLFEAVNLFESDFRVRVVFAHDDSSAFSAGVPELLRAESITPVPLPELSGASFDLALTASENVDLTQISAPVVVVPHGIGFHRYVPDSTSPGTRLSGVVPVQRLHGTDTWMTISHPAQRDQLRAENPEAANRCVVVGDLAYDRMVASLPLRERYRRALGIAPSQRLVVVTSTWGTGSLIESWRELPARLAGELPRDEYKVALVLHPNVWTWHGDYSLRLWLSRARAAGLMVMPPEGSWQSLLIAADLVIGDHGSVTLYGAALDRPVLLAGDYAKATVVPGTPPGKLAGTADRLIDGPPLSGQVTAAISAHDRGRFDFLVARMFARRGEAAETLRDFLYSRLRLPVPDLLPVISAPAMPEPDRTEPHSFVVFSRSEKDRVRLWRYPAAVRNAGPPDSSAVRHLLADEEEPDMRLPANAAVIVRRDMTDHISASAWLDELFTSYPGCQMGAAAVADGCLARLWDGRRLHLSLPPDACSLGASALYARIREGQPTSGRITVQAGAASIAIELSPWPEL
ncbi:MAG: hypothetical protein J2P25_00785 [Nocardiopsaceae bacterium]|nr:hypothetical protein [Nocardiopsaceae bacterium]